MKNLQAGNYFIKIIALSNLIFLILIGTLFYFNRIAIDDFYFLANVKEYGIIQGTIVEHSSWSGRWISVLLNQFVLSFYHFKHFLFVYGISALFLFIYAVRRVIHNLNSVFNWWNLNFWIELNISIFIISAFFYSSIKIDETWFWLCASCTYLMSMVMFFLGASTIISPQKGILNTVICILSFTYIGGSCEPFALMVLILLLIFGLANYFELIVFNSIKPFLSKRFSIAFICCLTSFVILYIADGNRVREQFFEERSIWKAFVLNIKTTGMIIILRLPLIIPFIILFSIPAYYLGYLKSSTTIVKNVIRLRITFIILLYFSLLYIYQLPVTYVTQDIAAYRALFPVTLYSLLAGFGIFYNLGLAKKNYFSITRFVVLFSLIIVCCVNIYTLTFQLRTLPKYAESYDKRIDYLLKNVQKDGLITVEPLLYSGLLYSAEISTDSLYFANKHLQKGLGIKSSVVLSSH